MLIAAQFLEGDSLDPPPSPADARARLRAAFDRVPLAMVLLGWDHELRLIEACAEECARQGAVLYLWQPLLTGHGRFLPEAAWRVVALNGAPVPAFANRAEWTFMCPNHPVVREAVLGQLSAALACGCYRGVFLDRIRFPSPAGGLAKQFGCFCESCQAAVVREDLDLSEARQDLTRLLATDQGGTAAILRMLSGSGGGEAAGPLRSFERMLTFRQHSISGFVEEAAGAVMAQGLKVGLDCFSPTLAPMVGQDLGVLAGHCGWIKVMTYARAYGPATLPFEILQLADWLVASGAESEPAALGDLAAATGWPLPADRDDVRQGRLPASILTEELRRGRASGARRLLAGIELVEIPGVAHPSLDQIRDDAGAVLAAAPDGVVLSWDLRHMPLDRLDLANALYRQPTG